MLRVDPAHGAALSQLAFLSGRIADWSDRGALVEQFRAGVASGQPLLSPFAFLSLPSTRAEQRRCAQTWAADLAGVEPLPRRRVLSVGRLRIGYLSADFHTHATAFLAAGLFERHDRARFEIFGYSTGPDDRSPMRARLVRAFDRFADMRDRNPLAVADQIRSDGVDILVDLKGHTEGATPIVLARHPAPIQAHYLGYPGTVAAGLVDYLIGDPVVTPPEHVADYAEAMVTLPDSYQINDVDRPIGETPPRAELGLPDGALVFASFNQYLQDQPAGLRRVDGDPARGAGRGPLAAGETRRRSSRRQSPPRGAGAGCRTRAPRVRARIARTPSTLRCTGMRISSSTRGRTTRTRRRAMRCGQAVRC